jgi:nitroreductase
MNARINTAPLPAWPRRLVVALLARSPALDGALRRAHRAVKLALARERSFAHHLADWRHTRVHMRWTADDTSRGKLSAALLFQYHKLEKGLCMGGPPRFFGLDPARETCALVERWRQAGHPVADPVYAGAIETLRSYRQRLLSTPAPAAAAGTLARLLDAAIAGVPPRADLATPTPHRQSDPQLLSALATLVQERRSVRHYQPGAVPDDVLARAVQLAQASPSACNRQPWRVHRYGDAGQIAALLALQNGNAGFGHQLQTLLAITVDSDCFFDGSERHQPFIDGGLFTMSLLLALQAQGVSTCCLNWCVSPGVDAQAHQLGAIPASQRIVMFLAAGRADEAALVPRSPRRDGTTVLQAHG